MVCQLGGHVLAVERRWCASFGGLVAAVDNLRCANASREVASRLRGRQAVYEHILEQRRRQRLRAEEEGGNEVAEGGAGPSAQKLSDSDN